MSKLTKEQVQEIVRTPKTRGTVKDLAQRYGVSQGRISQLFKSHGGGTSNVEPELNLEEKPSGAIYELKY